MILPKTSPPSGAAETVSGDASLDLRGKRVVVCEDEGVTLMQVKRTLAQAGLQVVGVADDGEMAVETVLRERPDLVLMDIQMPKMNGLAAAARILEAYSVCVVMVTAFSDEEYRQKAQDVGACGYILKPVTRDTLLPQLTAAWQKYHKS